MYDDWCAWMSVCGVYVIALALVVIIIIAPEINFKLNALIFVCQFYLLPLSFVSFRGLQSANQPEFGCVSVCWHDSLDVACGSQATTQVIG